MLNNIASLLASVTEGIDNLYAEYSNLEAEISSLSMRVVAASALVLFVLMGIAVVTNEQTKRFKLPLFIMMSFVMAGSTLLLAVSTIYLNTQSDSGGPVSWQAGIEFWVCDNEIELIDPEGISRKIGSSTLYEQDDKLIHLEGVIVDNDTDASLGKFMDSVGGGITDEALMIPVNLSGIITENDEDNDGPSDPYSEVLSDFTIVHEGSRYVKAESGQMCAGEYSDVQVFVYKFNESNNTYEQTKISNPQYYAMSPEGDVPPGDCIMVEFGPQKDKTDKLCQQYDHPDYQQINYSPIDNHSDPNEDREAK